MGMHAARAGNFKTALEHFNMSLQLNKDYEKAQSWQQKVRRSPLTAHPVITFTFPPARPSQLQLIYTSPPLEASLPS
jgi:hypothetical protein